MQASVVLMLITLASAVQAEEALPKGFLEYLGGMVETDGELMDPILLEMDTEVAAELDRETAETEQSVIKEAQLQWLGEGTRRDPTEQPAPVDVQEEK